MPELFLLSLSGGDCIVDAGAGGSPGRHAAARYALEHALELRCAVREAVAPEAVAGVLDELDEGDQEPPLFISEFSGGGDSGWDAGGRGGVSDMNGVA